MQKSKRADGWWYPWLFVGAFGIIITVNGIMAYIAVDSWTGLETKSPFQRSQTFNVDLAQKTAQAKLGWAALGSFEASPTAEQPRAGFMRLVMKDADGAGLSGLTIDAMAKRPTHEGYDQPLNFIERGAGLYVAPITFPLAGQWDFDVTASRGDDVYKMRQRLQVP